MHLRICAADCGIPMDVPRASYIPGLTVEGSTITYQCEQNTVMEGSATITCGPDGMWSKTDVYCRRKCWFYYYITSPVSFWKVVL